MHIYILEILLLTHLKQSIQMGIVTVYAAIRKKSPQMQVGMILLTVIDRTQELFVLKEHSVLNVLSDQCEILVNDPSRSDIHMTNLGITHLPVRKSYRKT